MCNITKFATFYQLSCWWNFWPSSTTLTFDLSCPNQLPTRIGEESTNTTIILRLLGTWSRGASVRFLFNWGTADLGTFCWTTRPRSRRFTNSKIKIYDLGHKLGPIEKKWSKTYLTREPTNWNPESHSFVQTELNLSSLEHSVLPWWTYSIWPHRTSIHCGCSPFYVFTTSGLTSG